jgi:hypothetical protein
MYQSFINVILTQQSVEIYLHIGNISGQKYNNTDYDVSQNQQEYILKYWYNINLCSFYTF